MHTLYKEHTGSYAVAVPWLVSDGVGGSYSDWHTLFTGLSLPDAMGIVRYLNGGDLVAKELLAMAKECAA